MGCLQASSERVRMHAESLKSVHPDFVLFGGVMWKVLPR